MGGSILKGKVEECLEEKGLGAEPDPSVSVHKETCIGRISPRFNTVFLR